MSQNNITYNNYDPKNTHINVNIILIIIETTAKVKAYCMHINLLDGATEVKAHDISHSVIITHSHYEQLN